MFSSTTLKFRRGAPDSFRVPCAQTKYAIIPNSTFWIQRRSRNFHTRSFRLKVGPTPKCRFKPTSTTGLGIRPGASGSERRVILDQTRHSETKRAFKIFIRARLPKMLTQVNRWPNFGLKLLKVVQTSAENPGTRVNHAPSINRPFRSYWNCQNSDPRQFSHIFA